MMVRSVQKVENWDSMSYIINLSLCVVTAASKIVGPIYVLAFLMLKIIVQLQKTIVLRRRKHKN